MMKARSKNVSKRGRPTPKERNLLKGAIRRVFSRSDLRRQIVDSTRIDHFDPNRPRVKKWSLCPICNQKVPTYLIQVDHKEPVIPVDSSFEEMSLDTVVDRMWCDAHNLQPICESCHDEKTKKEKEARKQFKKLRKKGK